MSWFLKAAQRAEALLNQVDKQGAEVVTTAKETIAETRAHLPPVPLPGRGLCRATQRLEHNRTAHSLPSGWMLMQTRFVVAVTPC
jgi:hypothetical protein